MVDLKIGNALSQIQGMEYEDFQLLSFELSYQVTDDQFILKRPQRFLQEDGSVKTVLWDGLKRLMTPRGVFPSGLVPRVLRLLGKWQIPVNVIDLREVPMEGIPLWTFPKDFALRLYQKEAVERALHYGRGVIDSPPRCISGDVRVQINRGAKTYWITIRELARKFNGRALGTERLWDLCIPTKIRARDHDGSIKLFDLARAWESGTKDLRRVCLSSGAALIASEDHLVLTPFGWIPLKDLRPGYRIMADISNSQTGPVDVVSIKRFGDGDTYDLQVPGAANFLAEGIVTHNSGKTIIMAELVRSVASKTVITAPTEPIASQTYHKFLELFADNCWAGQGRCDKDFYLLTGGPPKTNKELAAFKRAKVFVATAATAVGMPEVWWSGIKCLIVDERHHQVAKTYLKINKLASNAYWRWGFTGTNYRSLDHEVIALEACLGRIVASYSIKEMTDQKILVPALVRFVSIDFPGMKYKKFQDAYKQGIVESERRNQSILRAAVHYQREGRKVLILVHRINHGKRLETMISGSRFVQGSDGAEVRQAVADLDSGKLSCLIGSPVVGEGLDCPAADCLIYAKGFKARVTHTQDTFRVLTGAPEKRPAIILDFADRQNKTLMAHSIARMHNYLAMGFKIEVSPEIHVDTEQLPL